MTATHHGHAILILEVDGAGAHPAAWRRGHHAPDAVLDAKHTARTVLAAESAGFHAVSFEDGRLAPTRGPGARLDAIQRAAYVGPLTHSIGLLPVADSIYTEPFHLSTQLAALDAVSSGRAGWIVSASGTADEGAAVGREGLEPGELAGEVADVLEASRRLWDSWEDGAVIKDTATGRYLDRSKVHYADFTGKRFSVKGPSISPRPVQGQIPVFAHAPLDSGSDASLFGARDLEGLLAAAPAGDPHGIRIAELEVVLDHAGEPAAERLAALEERAPWQSPRARFTGTAAELTAYLAELLGRADGVRLHPAELHRDAPELAASVLPALRRAGVLRPIRTGNTLRETLGLPSAANRYAAG